MPNNNIVEGEEAQECEVERCPDCGEYPENCSCERHDQWD